MKKQTSLTLRPHAAAHRAGTLFELPMRQSQVGSTAVGVMIGLVIGLLISVLVAVFVTKAPVPWVNKAQRAPETAKAPEPKSPAEMPDPNKSLHSKSTKGPDGLPASGADADGIGSILKGMQQSQTSAPPAPPTVPSLPSTSPQSTQSSKSTDPTQADKPAEDNTRYMLQAGAFRDRDEAEAMKGKLALLGYEARISTIEREGNTIYRIRTGPFKQLDEANGVRRKLADGGVETSLIPLR